MRAELNREIVVRVRVENEAGVLTDATGTPTLAVTNGAGAAVAGVSSVTTDGTGVYKATIPPRSVLDRLALSWTVIIGGVTRTYSDRVDLVSERLVPFFRLKEDSELASASVLTLQRISDGVEEWFGDALHYPPVIEAWRGSFTTAHSSPRLHVPGVSVPISMIALTRGRGASAYAYTAPEIADLYAEADYFASGSSNVSFLTGSPSQATEFPAANYTAHLTHGLADPPEDLRRAAATFARYIARTSNYPERAARVISQESEIVFSFPSPEKPTGLPEVDAVLHRMRLPAFG